MLTRLPVTATAHVRKSVLAGLLAYVSGTFCNWPTGHSFCRFVSCKANMKMLRKSHTATACFARTLSIEINNNETSNSGGRQTVIPNYANK